MKWRVMVEVTGEDGAVTQHVIAAGERSAVGQAATLGLSLAESKATVAGVQRVLAGTGGALPYRRARTLLAELLPLDTTRRWKRSAGARSGLEPGSNGRRLSHQTRWREQRRSCCLSTGATCGRCGPTRCARSR